jgi:PAS domain S-box-containing protein
MIGRDGMVGVHFVLGGVPMNHRVVVQCAGQAYRMPAHVFVDELSQCPQLQRLALCCVQALITQMAQSIVCIGHHSVIERLCYWLLLNSEALLSVQLRVTHEMIANMLGVRRESVTQALGKLQAAGWVTSGRGKISILDREGLTRGVCECFSQVSQETQRLFERAGGGSDAFLWPQTERSGGADLQGHGLQRYQDAYDFAPVGFVSVDAQCRVLQTNLAGAIMLGVQRSQTLTMDFLNFLSTPDRSIFKAFHQEVLSGKCRRHCEVSLQGSEHRGELILRIEATLDEDGRECQLVLIDVTQEKREAAQKLAREREQQEMLVKQPYMVWFKDPEGHLISANANLIDNWHQLAQPGRLEKVDAQSMPWNFFDRSSQPSARPEL